MTNFNIVILLNNNCDMVSFDTLQKEIISLAAEHTSAKVEFRHMPEHDVWYCDDVMESYGSIFGEEDVDYTDFVNEVERLRKIIHTPLKEPILPDNYPVHQGYIYVADGKPRMFIDGEGMTVGMWKALPKHGVSEVRECDLTGRRLRLKPNDESLLVLRNLQTHPTTDNRKRKPRKTYKIKRSMNELTSV